MRSCVNYAARSGKPAPVSDASCTIILHPLSRKVWVYEPALPAPCMLGQIPVLRLDSLTGVVVLFVDNCT
jgi:hypothetical protein